MAAERLILEKLLEVIGHADKVQLDVAVLEMDPCRVDISEYHALLMDMGESLAKLSEG